jgi:hypothetical protein
MILHFRLQFWRHGLWHGWWEGGWDRVSLQTVDLHDGRAALCGHAGSHHAQKW